MAIAGFRHFGLKVVSIALAALLWALVSGEQVVERALRVPLEFTNVPTNLELVGDPANDVDVRVRGSSGSLGRIATGELVAVLDLRGAVAGKDQLFHLTEGDVRSPFGVEVVQVNPSTIRMSFERSEVRPFPIMPAVEGDPATGFVVGVVTSDPQTVMLVGPPSVLDMVSEAITEPISVKGATTTVTKTVNVGSPQPNARLKNATTARVVVPISPAPVELTVPGVAVQIRNAGRPTQVSPRVVTVHARGPRERRAVNASQFDASVDVSGLRAGQFDLEVHVVPPSQLGVVRVDPPKVRVTIR
jgi:hypothetical protein